jgi:hypothetical protein
MPKAPVGDSEFVLIWQHAASLGDVVRLCGYKSKKATTIAGQRAKRLREMGVELRTFHARRPNVEKLRWFAARAAEAAK